MSAPLTPRALVRKADAHERDYVTRLLKKAEFDMHRITNSHRALAIQAEISQPPADQLVDDWIRSFSTLEARKVIDALRGRLDQDAKQERRPHIGRGW